MKFDQIAFAGLLMREDGATMVGSLLSIDFDSKDDTIAWLADEPFSKAGLCVEQRSYGF
ncbi:hypothetical protein [Pseudomonas sp. NPDC087614]|uniref:hypothetical protein n=1 Tax=Pseudomonas sp. NPDC087614 TaxID=3364442 RepID=UPI00380AA565